jgi:uncharacterized membrane protein
VSLKSTLGYVGMVLAIIALVFLAIGVSRTRSLSVRRSTAIGASDERQRLKAIRRADWISAALLLCLALVAFALTLIETGPFFTERSGNIAGAMVLISMIVGLIVAIVLLIRLVALSRALRALGNSRRNYDRRDPPGPTPTR